MTEETIAVFDFDNTITHCDTLLPFLLYAKNPLTTWLKLALLTPQLLAYASGILSRQATKESVLTSFFKGRPIEELRVLGNRFAKEKLMQYIKPEALNKVLWHQKQNHRCILISASLDIYLEPWAKSVGFQDVLPSKLAFDSKGKVTGKLEGLNCWGPEKVRRLLERTGSKNYTLYAYGDSRGDKELLGLADYPFYRHF